VYTELTDLGVRCITLPDSTTTTTTTNEVKLQLNGSYQFVFCADNVKVAVSSVKSQILHYVIRYRNLYVQYTFLLVTKIKCVSVRINTTKFKHLLLLLLLFSSSSSAQG
jgi:hypothetical protein